MTPDKYNVMEIQTTTPPPPTPGPPYWKANFPDDCKNHTNTRVQILEEFLLHHWVERSSSAEFL